MSMSIDGPRLAKTFANWWNDTLARDGFRSTARQLVAHLWDYVRESMPDQRRQRYGDADYDWDYRVNTTSGGVGWRDRLLGQFLSAYQPTEPALFHEMLGDLKIDFRSFTFIDLGSGKGRALLMAADYPFRRILGVELLPELHAIAQENIGKYQGEQQKCFEIETLCMDARSYLLPREPVLLYLFNPLPEAALMQVVRNLEQSLREAPRPVYVLYHNPLLEHVLANSSSLEKVAGTHQYSLHANKASKSKSG
jgi:SAM-dependent methyltransferase